MEQGQVLALSKSVRAVLAKKGNCRLVYVRVVFPENTLTTESRAKLVPSARIAMRRQRRLVLHAQPEGMDFPLLVNPPPRELVLFVQRVLLSITLVLQAVRPVLRALSVHARAWSVPNLVHQAHTLNSAVY